MNIAFIFLLGILRASSNAAAISEADRLFGYGENSDNERRALEILERALMSEPNDYQLLWRAARSYYYVGDGAAKDRIIYFERGIQAAKRAVAQDPGGIEGHYWLGASWGGYCREKGGITAFRNVKNVRAEMETVLRVDASFEDGSAYFALGEIDRQLPRLFGGSLDRSITYLEKGLSVAPRNPQMKVSLAESYLEAKRTSEARRQLDEAVQLPLTSSRTNENRRAQEKARKLLVKLGAVR